ncbi:MAG: YqaJ viral recombinase family protein [Pseudomonadota bacterium]
MLTAEQLQERRTGIGGSDIAAVLGLSPYQTPLDVYRDKLGLAEDEDLSGKAPIEWGNRLEDVVAAKFADETKLGSRVQRRSKGYVHGEHPILKGNIDRAITGTVFGGLKAGLECKTADKWAARDLWGKGSTFEWSDEGELLLVESDDQVPDWYRMQCAHYQAITGADVWFLSVLIGGNDFRTYTIFRDEELEALMIEQALLFWNEHVLAQVPPAPVNQRDLESLYPRNELDETVADAETVQAVADLKELTLQVKALEAKIDGVTVGGTKVGGLKNKVREAIGSHAELLLDPEGKPIATWKNQRSSKRFDEQAFKAAHPKLYREFSVEREGSRVLLIK